MTSRACLSLRFSGPRESPVSLYRHCQRDISQPRPSGMQAPGGIVERCRRGSKIVVAVCE
jgi:hypothetical protein